MVEDAESTQNPSARAAAAAALQWYAHMGVDEAIGDDCVDGFARSAELAARRASVPARTEANSGGGTRAPLNRPAAPASQAPRPVPRQPAAAPSMAMDEVEQLAQSCNSLDELARTLDEFDACPLKRTATQLCFADGLPDAHVMIIGEAPGRDEDEQGRPFVGKSGQLLDKMLACIDLDRASDDPAKSAFISNIVFWRPPGNRKPSTSEVVMCLPFVRRAIELAKPRIVIAAGATPAQALLNTPTGITRMRGTWKTIATGSGEVDVMPTLHPSYLLRSPEAKRFAWRDLLAVKAKLLAM
ncbi:MAG: uracil-DNA glycosylase [Pseudomonadota bacterium]